MGVEIGGEVDGWRPSLWRANLNLLRLSFHAFLSGKARRRASWHGWGALGHGQMGRMFVGSDRDVRSTGNKVFGPPTWYKMTDATTARVSNNPDGAAHRWVPPRARRAMRRPAGCPAGLALPCVVCDCCVPPRACSSPVSCAVLVRAAAARICRSITRRVPPTSSPLSPTGCLSAYITLMGPARPSPR